MENEPLTPEPEVPQQPGPPVDATPFPAATVADIRQLQAEQQRAQNEIVRTLRGYFQGKDLDIEKDHITVDLEALTWRMGVP